MIKYQKITGVKLGGNALQTIQQTPEGLAMGAVPGWSIMLDPDYSDTGGARNRARPSTVAQWSSPPNMGEFGNGATAFNPNDDEPARLMPPLGGFDPERWSVFFVISDLVPSPFSSRQHIVTPTEEQAGVICPRITVGEIGGTTVNIYENSIVETGQPTRLVYNPAGIDSSDPALFICTFSVEHGLSIWKNGEKVSENPDDRRPLNFGYQASEIEFFRYIRAKLGMTGVINIDLNAPENTGHRRAIEKFLMAKYDIPEGPQ